MVWKWQILLLQCNPGRRTVCQHISEKYCLKNSRISIQVIRPRHLSVSKNISTDMFDYFFVCCNNGFRNTYHSFLNCGWYKTHFDADLLTLTFCAMVSSKHYTELVYSIKLNLQCIQSRDEDIFIPLMHLITRILATHN